MEMHEWACSAHLISMFACIFKAAVGVKLSDARFDRASFVSAQELFKSEQDGLQPNHALVLRSLKGWCRGATLQSGPTLIVMMGMIKLRAVVVALAG